MKWKIIFFDLDGTLVDHNFFLSPHIISSVKKIQNLGLRISIATGRSQDSATGRSQDSDITKKVSRNLMY